MLIIFNQKRISHLNLKIITIQILVTICFTEHLAQTEKIREIILEIEDNNKASGPDSIPLKVLKKAKDAIANYFVRFSILLLIWDMWYFIDLQKALDTVDINILLEMLSHFGIRNTTNQWFHSYLTNKEQYASVNRFNSDLNTI